MKGSLKEIAKVFFKIGCIGFGGPAAHIAMIEAEVVRKRKWMSEQYFLDLIGATNLIPGPNSTEMAMHCGYQRGGWKGLVVAGSCFIFPAVLITGVLAYLYAKYGSMPEVTPFIYGIKPAVIALVISLMITLLKKALKTWSLGIAGIIAIVLSFSGLHELYVFFGVSFAGVLFSYLIKKRDQVNFFIPYFFIGDIITGSHLFNWKLFWPFLKIGSILYGSGYMLFTFLNAEFVTTGILSSQKLTDAIAVGQITPGPVFSSATFIGWQMDGFSGAVAATAGIFLPSFLFVALLNPVIPLFRKSVIMGLFLDYVNIVSVALILVTCYEMARVSVSDWRTTLIAILGLLITFRYKRLNSAFIILGGSLFGYFLTFF